VALQEHRPVTAADPDLARRVGGGIVGREREIDLVLGAVTAGRDILLEGPPGTSKSTLLRAITSCWGVPFLLVEGNADLTPSKLVGHHNPARVLVEDYSHDNFVPGPLVQAMASGGFLYIEELNRAPEDTLNVLLAAMAERKIALPRVGTVVAEPTFRVMASMNPFDNVGTARISASVYDRWCRLTVGYQSVEEEERIVAVRTGCTDPRLIADAVALTRATRSHPELRRGSSVRGAIDLVAVTRSLTGLNPLPEKGNDEDRERAYRSRVLEAAYVALSARVGVEETVDATPESVIKEIWEDHFILLPRRAAKGPRRIVVENAIAIRNPGADPSTFAMPQLQPLARKPKQLDSLPSLFAAGGKAPTVMALGGPDRLPGDFDPDLLAGLGAAGPVVTEETAEIRPLDDLFEERSREHGEVRAMAERIGQRLSIRRSRHDHSATRGIGALESVPYRYGSDDIDLDRTIEILAERPVPEDTDIVVRERMRTKRAVVLLVDVSGSMRGEKVKMTAATVGALAADLVHDDLAVVAFWKDAALIKPLDGFKPHGRVLDELLRIPAKGLTNLHFALNVGLGELSRSHARSQIGLLLSDAVHNAGPDPRMLAGRFPTLHVLLQTDGEHDAFLAGELARLGRGLVAPVADHRAVAPALNRLLSG
jgi:MoxR-like ATPase/Mg-chelatase subunit ChlD